MTRDYKRRTNRKKKRKSTPPWLWLVAGFALGLVAAYGLFRSGDNVERTAAIPTPQTVTQPQSARDADAEMISAAKPASNDAAEALPPAGSDDYTFYKTLPDFEVFVADEADESSGSEQSAARSARSAPPAPGTYILQAGSFRKFTDADRRKAELAFQGIESNIQRVVLGNDQIWHRVYVGPTQDLGRLENQRSTLRRANIDVLLLKVKQ